jgi:hypothetical protein
MRALVEIEEKNLIINAKLIHFQKQLKFAKLESILLQMNDLEENIYKREITLTESKLFIQNELKYCKIQYANDINVMQKESLGIKNLKSTIKIQSLGYGGIIVGMIGLLVIGYGLKLMLKVIEDNAKKNM